MSVDLADQTLSADTVQGSQIAIDAIDGVTINAATLVSTYTQTWNGVIHVIDNVTPPPS